MHATFTDVQAFPDGKLGITNCVPLWSRTNDTEAARSGIPNGKYHGAYCFDVYPSSFNADFVKKFYDDKKGEIVDYIIFNKIYGRPDSDLIEEVQPLLQRYVFTDVKDDQGRVTNYDILEVTIRTMTVNDIEQ